MRLHENLPQTRMIATFRIAFTWRLHRKLVSFIVETAHAQVTRLQGIFF